MALLTAVSVGTAKTTVAPNSVTSSDTISQSDIGLNGALLQVINGSGGSINVTIADPGVTAVGNAGTPLVQAVANGTDGWFLIAPGYVNPSTGVATVAFSGTTSVTYKLLRGPAR